MNLKKCVLHVIAALCVALAVFTTFADHSPPVSAASETAAVSVPENPVLPVTPLAVTARPDFKEILAGTPRGMAEHRLQFTYCAARTVRTAQTTKNNKEAKTVRLFRGFGPENSARGKI